MKIDLAYLATPFLAWLTAGCLKFLINSWRAKRLAFELIGYGGSPSNHSAIVSSMASLVGLKEGIGSPAFGVAITLAFIVVLDATSLRRHVGRHAQALNQLMARNHSRVPRLRERLGHSPNEVIVGIATGAAVATLSQSLLVPL